MVLKVIIRSPVLVPWYSLAPPSASSGSPSISASSANRAPSNSTPSYSHHRLDTRILSLRTASSQRSRISCVTIYFETLFWLVITYDYTSSKPASRIASSKGGYSQLPFWSHGWILLIQWATLWWKPPRSLSVWVVIAHLSNPKRRTAWTTALKKISDTRVFPFPIPVFSTF